MSTTSGQSAAAHSTASAPSPAEPTNATRSRIPVSPYPRPGGATARAPECPSFSAFRRTPVACQDTVIDIADPGA